MRTQKYLTRLLRIVGLVALATVLITWITWEAYDSSHSYAGIAEAGSTNVKSNHKRLTALQRLRRDEFWASRQGLQFGVPAHGLADAAAQMRSSELGLRNPSGSSQFEDVFSEFSGQPSFASFAAAWTFIGPQPIQEKANFTGLVFGNDFAATGRITSVAADSTGLIVVGAASGGVWLSQNSGTTFSPVFDTGPTQAIGAVALDTTTTPSTIYIGTGEGNGSFDSLWGQGMFKSTDLGVTWTAVGPAGTFDHNSFTSIAIVPTKTVGAPIIFAGLTTGFSAGRTDPAIFESDQTLSGLWMSSNGGTSWTHYPASTFGGCEVIVSTNSPCPADDVKVDPTNPQNVYVAIDSFNVFYSHNGGTSWTQAAFPGGAIHQGRQGLAIGPPDAAGEPGIVYALVGASDGAEYAGFFVSVDGGVTWDPGTFLAPTVPSFTQGGVTIDGTGTSNDAVSFYDNTILVSPSSSSTVFVGGVGLYRSTDHGHTWTFLPANGGVHTDQHALAFDPASGLILEGTDGGLFDFDPTTSTPTFTSFNTLISASQVQGVSAHPTDPTKLVAGFQDNGTQVYSGMVNTWFGADSENGDGGVELYDQIDPTHIYHDFSDDNNGNPGISVSTDGGSTWCSEPGAAPCNPADSEWTPNLITQLNVNADIAADGGGSLFYPPLAVDPSVAHRVLFAAHGVYVSTDAMAHWAAQTNQDLTSPTCFMALDPTSCAVDDIEFAPSDDTKAWTVAASSPDGSVPFAVNNTTQANVQVDGTHTNGGLWTDVTANLNKVFPVANTQATGIAVDPHNANVAYLTLSGFTSGANIGTGVAHIYKTTDFGTTWAEADGSTSNGAVPGANPLPDVPVLRVLVDSTDSSGTCGGKPCSNSIFAGTDLGMFHSSDGGQDWFPYNLGVIPMVPVYDLSQDTLGNIYAGTHGRGVFALNVLSATATPTATQTATATATRTATATVTATSSQTSTSTPTPSTTATGTGTPTASATPTRSPTPSTSGTPTATPSPSTSGTPTATGTGTPTASATPTASTTPSTSGTPTATPSSSTSGTPTATATPTASVTATATQTATATPTPTAATPTPTATPTPVPVSLNIPKTLNFGSVKVGMSKMKHLSVSNPKGKKNKSRLPVLIEGVSGAPEFSATIGNCPMTLDAGAKCTIDVTFMPTSKGKQQGMLSIDDNANRDPQQVKLEGTGK